MLVCPSCNNMQESGKFCGFCGNETVPAENIKVPQEMEVTSQAAAAASPMTSSNTEAAKEVVGQYWSYIIQLFKNPSLTFRFNENHFVYGLINMALYALSFTLTIYIALNSAAKDSFLFGESLPFLPVVFRVFMVHAVMLAITFFSAVAFSKIGKSAFSVKKMSAQFGGFLAPFLGLNALALLGILVGSFLLTIVPLAISFLLVFLFVPVLFVYEITNGDRFRIYWSFGTVLLSSLIIYVVGRAFIIEQLIKIESMNPFW